MLLGICSPSKSIYNSLWKIRGEGQTKCIMGNSKIENFVFLTREYAKRNERVIGDDGKSLARSITQV